VIDGVVSPVLHSNVPVKFDAVSVDVPSQLSVTVTVGAAGALPGFAIPLPLGEVHPLTVCVTVYVPAVVTVMGLVVAPVLHNNDPVKFDAASVDVPSQLSVTVTVGAAGALPGFAIPLPSGEVHPAPTDCVTVYVPAVVTVIVGVVSPVLHSSVPVKFDAVSVDVPSQLSTTPTVGAVITAGSVITIPFSVCVHPPASVTATLYVPAGILVRSCVVAPLLHT
jgi:hypothetical protein